MSRRKCGCVYADAHNTHAVRAGYEMGGYLKTPCEQHAKPTSTNKRDGGEADRVINKILCWIGAHRVVSDEALITCHKSHCVHCGARFIDSMFGLFEVTSDEKKGGGAQ